jgi:hypothetical protein
MIKNYLQNVSFDFEENEESLGPHIAYTLEFQGGAASGYNDPILLKSKKTVITSEVIKGLKEVGIDTSSLEKSMFQSDLREQLQSAIREKAFCDEYDWCWVCDFNDEIVVFCSDDGLYSVAYVIEDNSVKVDNIANPVVRLIDYVAVDGEVKVSEEMEDKLEQQMMDMLNKANSQPDLKKFILKAVTKKEGNENLTADKYAYTPDKEKVSTWKLRIDTAANTSAAVAALGKGFRGNKVKIPSADLPAVKKKVSTAYKKFYPDKELPEILKSKTEVPASASKLEKGASVDLQELMKSNEFAELLKAEIAKATANEAKEKEELQKALNTEKERIAALEAKEVERVEKSHRDILKSFSSFIAEDKTEALVKAFMKDAETALVVIEVLEKANSVVEQVKKEFGAEVGVNVKVEDSASLQEKIIAKAKAMKEAQSK